MPKAEKKNQTRPDFKHCMYMLPRAWVAYWVHVWITVRPMGPVFHSFNSCLHGRNQQRASGWPTPKAWVTLFWRAFLGVITWFFDVSSDHNGIIGLKILQGHVICLHGRNQQRGSGWLTPKAWVTLFMRAFLGVITWFFWCIIRS